MIFLELFWVFFITNILGYGGGPAAIPLVQHEVVEVYGWVTEAEFFELLAAGNSLPGPIATKMAGHIGFLQGGVSGAAVALFATVAPSLILMILLMNLLLKHQDSPQVKKLSLYIKPTIAVLFGLVILQNLNAAWQSVGMIQTLILAIAAFISLQKYKIHPALVIGGALLSGALVL
jgi:chromate transporter